MVGLQAVGVVLVAAMLITPAVAARLVQSVTHDGYVVNGFGGAAGIIGTFLVRWHRVYRRAP